MNPQLVIIPTYNEKENVANMIKTVMELPMPFDLLFVDDGSPDGTADIIKQHHNQYPERIHLIQRTGKLGLGTAYITGFKWAIKQGYAYICEMDCDFSHNPQDLTRLVEACQQGADMSVGSRYTRGGGVENWPWNRRWMSKGAGVYVNVVLGLGVKDATAGFVCFKRKVLETINLDAIRFIGYAFQIEMKYKTKKSGFKIQEVPILFKDRILGQSKMSLNIFNEAFIGVLKMRLG
ncbi:MAG: polyprenol monophosphomannose synthase [Bacteroidetes bacterium]|nr:polyprenol monophosphomannose synthase [Bacteroidota bacterium]